MHGDDIARAVADAQRPSPAPRWRGVPCQQFPSDLWRYAELLHELRPPWVLECGTAGGGTALFLADVLKAAGGEGRVISADNDPRPVAAAHPRLELVKCDTLDRGLMTRVTGMAARGRGLVLLDDDHSPGHVLAELDAYGPLACYLVVEDTLMEHLPGCGDGPHLALAKWLPAHPEFTADPEPVPTNHPGGWLRRR